MEFYDTYNKKKHDKALYNEARNKLYLEKKKLSEKAHTMTAKVLQALSGR